MFLRYLLASILVLGFCAVGSARAEDTAPAPPSDLQVTAVGVNAFKLKWKDNSNNEEGWDVRVSLKGGAPQHYQFIRVKDITSYTVTTNDLPGFGLVFQLAAFNGAVDSEVVSAPSAIVAVKALSPKTFDTPTDLTAETVDDGRIRLKWNDNSTSEKGYVIQFKTPTAKTWKALGNTQADLKFSVIASGLSAKKEYQFRVKAFNDTKFTPYSNTATAITKSLLAPIDLEATAAVEGSFTFKWKDRSNAEAGYELEQKIGSGEFSWVWRFGQNVSETELLKDFPLDQEVQFRLRSFYLRGTDRVYSGYSSIITSRSTALAKPTEPALTTRTDAALTVTWKDNSLREGGYQIEYRKTGTTGYTSKTAAAGAQTFTITGLDAGQNYDIRVRAYEGGFFTPVTYSAYSTLIQGTTKDGVGGDLGPLLSLGVPFIYQVHVTNTALLTGVTVTGLPGGLTYNSETRTVSGTIDKDGTFALTVTATFSDGTTSTRVVTVRSTTPPLVTEAFAARTVAVAGSVVVPVTGKFNDPDTTSAARFETSSGQFDIIFFPTAAPKTVDNFIDYMDAGEYNDSFFHRSPVNFVVQGGGYKHTTAGGFTKVNKGAPVENEPGVSNVRGTVAMAKLGGNPNSATSEWFVNVADNSGPPPALDTQNGGFTVFGRVPTKGMIVVDKINKLPLDVYDVVFGTETIRLDDLPVNGTTAPAVIDPTKLVKILSCGPAPILTYEVTSQTPSVATAILSGTDITVTGVTVGTATIQVKATDLDGNSVTQTFTVTVS